jgi:hypothetical protein
MVFSSIDLNAFRTTRGVTREKKIKFVIINKYVICLFLLWRLLLLLLFWLRFSCTFSFLFTLNNLIMMIVLQMNIIIVGNMAYKNKSIL